MTNVVLSTISTYFFILFCTSQMGQKRSRLSEKKVPIRRDSESRKGFLPGELDKGLQKKGVWRVRGHQLKRFQHYPTPQMVVEDI